MRFPRASAREQFITILILLVCVGLLALGWRLAPDPRGLGTHTQMGFPECGFLVRHGFPCPSCGMTTAFCYGVRLRVVSGFLAQPVGLVAALLCYLLGVAGLYFFYTVRSPYGYLSQLYWGKVVMWIIIFLVLSWGFKIIAYKNGW